MANGGTYSQWAPVCDQSVMAFSAFSFFPWEVWLHWLDWQANGKGQRAKRLCSSVSYDIDTVMNL